MNILILSTDYKPRPGGIAEYTYQVAKHLRKMGCNVIVLSVKMSGDKEFDNNQDFETYRVPNISYLRSLMLTLMALILAKRCKAKYIFSTITHPCGEIAFLVSKLMHIKTVITVHGYEVIYPRQTLRERLKSRLRSLRTYIYNNISACFTVSNFTKEMLINSGVHPQQVSVYSNGIDLEEWKKKDQEREKKLGKTLNLRKGKIILTISALGERKGHDMVLRALPKVIREIPRLQYLIGGTGPYMENLKEITKFLNLEPYVKFLGYVVKDNLSPLYHLCDIFIMPNREVGTSVEGFGIVFLEANACKKPVIAGRSGGVLDAVIDGRTGLLVNPEDPDEIAIALVKLLTNKELAKRMGEEGYKRVKKELIWGRIVSRMLDTLKGISTTNDCSPKGLLNA